MDSMKKYEFKIAYYSEFESGEDIRDWINNFGLDGWELCAVIVHERPAYIQDGNYYFKRELP